MSFLDQTSKRTPLAEAVRRFERLPMFSPMDYAALNTDVAQTGMNVTEHALLYGCAEQRQVFKRYRLARALGEAIARTSKTVLGDQAPPAVGTLPPVSIYVNSWSGPAVADLAACLARDLEQEGVTATIRNERSFTEEIHELAIVVAPQDFFRLGLGPGWRSTGLPHTALMFNTAAPASADFVTAMPFLIAGRGVLDLSPQVVDMFCHGELPAAQVRPRMLPRARWLEERDLDNPLFKALPAAARHLDRGDADDPRPIDLAFMGRKSQRRSLFLGRIAREIADLRNFVHLWPQASSETEEILARRARFRMAGHVAARSKIALFIGDDEMPDFDWQSAFQAMTAGAAVLTDLCPPHRDLAIGVHLFQADLRHVPDLIRWLIEDEDGRVAAERARSASRALMSDPGAAKAWIARAAALWEAA